LKEGPFLLLKNWGDFQEFSKGKKSKEKKKREKRRRRKGKRREILRNLVKKKKKKKLDKSQKSIIFRDRQEKKEGVDME